MRPACVTRYLFFTLISASLPAQVLHKPARPVIRIAYDTQRSNVVYLPLELARALHYFEDAGLQVEMGPLQKHVHASELLRKKQAEFSGNSIAHAIEENNPQDPLKMVASFTNLPSVTLVIRKDLRSRIHSIKDLKGCRIGVSSIGSGTHILAASILASAGYSFNDVHIIPVGTGPSIQAAMKAKSIDAVLTTDPMTIKLLLGGDGSILLDLTSPEETKRVFEGNYQFTGLLTREDMIQEHPELVQSVVSVIVRTSHFIATHSATEIAAVLPSSVVGDRYIYIKSIEHMRKAFSQDAQVSPDAVENTIRSLAIYGSIPSTHIDPQRFYDMQFVKQARLH